MKIKYKLITLFSLLMAIIIMTSCTEEKPIGSEITYYPTFEVTGGQYLTIQQGTTFTDPGVIASAGEGTLPVTTTGSVNANQIGVYKLTYSATNVDGFDGTTFRYVAVVDDLDAISNNDLSASYTRNTNSAHVMTLTKIVDGFYQADDILPTNQISAIVVQVSSTKLVIPLQSSRFGDILADEFTMSGTGGDLVNGVSITLRTYISCCGIFARTFIKN